MRRKGWRGTGIGFQRRRRATLEGRPVVLTLAVGLWGSRFYTIVEVAPGKVERRFYPRADRVLRGLGYKPFWLGPAGQRRYSKDLAGVHDIDGEWERLRDFQVLRARAPGKPPKPHLFGDLVRWHGRSKGWSISGGEFELERHERSHGHRWLTRRSILLSAKEVCVAYFAWPARPFGAKDRRDLEARGFYRRADEALGRIGLTGRWGPMSAARPNELSADHWRRRLKPSDLPRVWKALSDWRLPSRP